MWYISLTRAWHHVGSGIIASWPAWKIRAGRALGARALKIRRILNVFRRRKTIDPPIVFFMPKSCINCYNFDSQFDSSCVKGCLNPCPFISVHTLFYLLNHQTAKSSNHQATKFQLDPLWSCWALFCFLSALVSHRQQHYATVCLYLHSLLTIFIYS